MPPLEEVNLAEACYQQARGSDEVKKLMQDFLDSEEGYLVAADPNVPRSYHTLRFADAVAFVG